MFFRHPLTLIAKEVPALTISASSTRLLIQDAHHSFTARQLGWWGKEANAKFLAREFDEYWDANALALAQMVIARQAARTFGIATIYVSLGYFPPDAPSAFQRATGWTWDLSGAEGVFPSELTPAPRERVFAKPGWGVLGNRDLAQTLVNEEVRCVILCGSVLEYGIRQTSIELEDLGIGVLILSDAVAPLTQAGRSAMSGGLSHGLIKSRATGELLQLFGENRDKESIIV